MARPVRSGLACAPRSALSTNQSVSSRIIPPPMIRAARIGGKGCGSAEAQEKRVVMPAD